MPTGCLLLHSGNSPFCSLERGLLPLSAPCWQWRCAVRLPHGLPPLQGGQAPISSPSPHILSASFPSLIIPSRPLPGSLCSADISLLLSRVSHTISNKQRGRISSDQLLVISCCTAQYGTNFQDKRVHCWLLFSIVLKWTLRVPTT